MKNMINSLFLYKECNNFLVLCGSMNKQIRGRKALEQGKYVLGVNFFAKQRHFCLASRISKFRTNPRNRKVN